MARIAQALGDPTRLRIYATIASGTQPCCGDLCRQAGVSAATMTHHVRVLQRAGLVEGRRDGAYVRVLARPETMDAYRAALARLGSAARNHRRSTA
jgi:ArsR family transcriptional regulator, arsenate/arsenite/antimonite-responsive transcriptional repressor